MKEHPCPTCPEIIQALCVEVINRTGETACDADNQEVAKTINETGILERKRRDDFLLTKVREEMGQI